MAPPLQPRSGFTLFEMMITLLISSVILLAFTQILITSTETERVASAMSSLENDAHEMLGRIADELRQTGTTCPDWLLETDTVTYNLCTGSAAGAKTWGTARALGASYEESGADDDLDNDGDGLTDERELLLGDASTGSILTTWGRDLSDPGLVFSLSGNELTITLSLTRRHPDGNPVSATASTVVSLRN